MERAENVARFMDVNHALALDLPEALEQWAPLVATSGDEAFFSRRYGEPTRENVLRYLTFDREMPSSILSCLESARENARSVREIISSEMWEQINEAYLMVQEAAQSMAVIRAPHDFFTDVKKASQLFVGITYLTMTHNEAWHFARLGRLIERADMTSRILDMKYFLLLPDPTYVGSPFDDIQWAALLRSASAFEMYRKRCGQIMPSQVVDFLLLDRQFPRSVRYCLRKGERSLLAITGKAQSAHRSPAEEELGKLVARLERTDVGEVLAAGLHDWLDTLQCDLIKVGTAIFESFFATTRSEGDIVERIAE